MSGNTIGIGGLDTCDGFRREEDDSGPGLRLKSDNSREK